MKLFHYVCSVGRLWKISVYFTQANQQQLSCIWWPSKWIERRGGGGIYFEVVLLGGACNSSPPQKKIIWKSFLRLTFFYLGKHVWVVVFIYSSYITEVIHWWMNHDSNLCSQSAKSNISTSLLWSAKEVFHPSNDGWNWSKTNYPTQCRASEKSF